MSSNGRWPPEENIRELPAMETTSGVGKKACRIELVFSGIKENNRSLEEDIRRFNIEGFMATADFEIDADEPRTKISGYIAQENVADFQKFVEGLSGFLDGKYEESEFTLLSSEGKTIR